MRNRICRCALALLTLALVAGGYTPARAQFTGSIVVKSSKSSQPKPEKFTGTVMFMTSTALTVRSSSNERMIRTFSYAPAIRSKMLEILNKGGYQYGDKVEVFSMPDSDVALRINGKPSKPL